MKVVSFFDKLEDKVRTRLARFPILYSIVGGIAIVLFWRSIWGIADTFQIPVFVSLILSTVVLLMTGLFVPFFVGDSILISGIRGEKKLIEKTEDEVDYEVGVLKRMHTEMNNQREILLQLHREIKELKHRLPEEKKEEEKIETKSKKVAKATTKNK